MNVVDSSAWLEYFADGPNAEAFAGAVTNIDELLVPSITIFEVFKRVRTQRDTEAALYAVAQMQRGRVMDLDADLAIAAAELSSESGLALADSIVLATAQASRAVLWTQDSDFEGLDGVEYREHRAKGSRKR